MGYIQDKPAKKITVNTLKEMKQRGEKVTSLTAYDHSMATIVDRAGIEMILVGDSLGNVMLGYDTTVPVTMEAMLHHTAAVSRPKKGSTSPTSTSICRRSTPRISWTSISCAATPTWSAFPSLSH